MRSGLSALAFLAAFGGALASPAWADYTLKGTPPGKVTVTQTSDGGTLTVGVTGSNFFASDSLGIMVLPGIPQSIRVRMLEIAGSLEVDLDDPLPGNLDLQLKNTATVDFIGTSNSIGGNLKIKAQDGSQVVEVAVNAALTVGKNLSIDLGAGDNDTVDEDARDITVGGNAKFTGVNEFEPQGVTTFMKNVTWNGKKETARTRFDNDGDMTIVGSLKFTGGAGPDECLLNTGIVSVGKNVTANLGKTTGTQFLFTNGTTTIGGKVIGKGQSPSNYISAAAAVHNGDVIIKFDKGTGSNTAIFAGTFNGKTVKYTGDDVTDDVSYQMTGNPAKVVVKLRDADDTLSLDAAADIGSLVADFGAGTDTFNNPFGATPPFPLKTKNLP